MFFQGVISFVWSETVQFEVPSGLQPKLPKSGGRDVFPERSTHMAPGSQVAGFRTVQILQYGKVGTQKKEQGIIYVFLYALTSKYIYIYIYYF